MTFIEFESHQEKVFDIIRNLGNTKGIEYAGDKDRFDNFNAGAEDVGIDRNKLLYVYLYKHWRAIQSYIKLGKVVSEESIHGRIYDAILYLILLDGMITEEESNYHNHSTCIRAGLGPLPSHELIAMVNEARKKEENGDEPF